jgi:hypothetical protein
MNAATLVASDVVDCAEGSCGVRPDDVEIKVGRDTDCGATSTGLSDPPRSDTGMNDDRVVHRRRSDTAISLARLSFLSFRSYSGQGEREDHRRAARRGPGEPSRG